MNENNTATMDWRQSTQALMPARRSTQRPAGYDLYPAHALGEGKIHAGHASLADWIATQQLVLIDGFAGIFWDTLHEALDTALQNRGLRISWHFMQDGQKDPGIIQQLVAPFVGKEGEVWGTKTSLQISDFFEADKLSPTLDTAADINIIIGTGAALAYAEAPLIYLDIPKNELQYRMRAGAVGNFGAVSATVADEMYKRAYFVDWVVLNDYKRSLLGRMDIMVDGQRPDAPTWIFCKDLEQGIDQLSRSPFRVRPWFEPGAWGGQWLKQHIPQLNRNVVNYAWSFELIVPENGVVFESDGYLLEIPFEWMMYYRYTAILGRHAEIFRYEFPIRFDFLDTFDGGNLSIQCHPGFSYIREHFGETFTQDETYYILDCKEGASVYLGLQEGINGMAFKKELENSRDHNTPIDIEQYVQRLPAQQHDLFLIPNGTVHSAGANNLVLEISATPYIFTFKMYDWLRLGLDGKPRAINIAHAFNNLDLSRQGAVVKEQLISKPRVIEQGADWQIVHLPTHAAHFYDVHRLEFDHEISIHTDNYCLVLMLVEGASITVSTANETTTVYHYAETFVIPAGTGACRIKNQGGSRAKLIKAFLKQEHYVFSNITSGRHGNAVQQ